MRLPRFRVRTLMIAVAVVALSCAIDRAILRYLDLLLVKGGMPPRATQIAWSFPMGIVFMAAITVAGGLVIASVLMIPQRLVALRKILRRRPFDRSG
jgi:hypothetical protein